MFALRILLCLELLGCVCVLGYMFGVYACRCDPFSWTWLRGLTCDTVKFLGCRVVSTMMCDCGLNCSAVVGHVVQAWSQRVVVIDIVSLATPNCSNFYLLHLAPQYLFVISTSSSPYSAGCALPALFSAMQKIQFNSRCSAALSMLLPLKMTMVS